jgi:phage baseplate assembly protein W
MERIIDNENNVRIDPGKGKIVKRGNQVGPGREEFTLEPLDFEKDISLGLDLPFSERSGKLFTLNYLSIDQAVVNLKNLILTLKGERVMHPNFGTNLRRYLFEPNLPSLREDVGTEIEEAVKFWLPYIRISDLEVTVPEAPAGSQAFVDRLHGISVQLTVGLINNTLDERTIVLEIKAD